MDEQNLLDQTIVELTAPDGRVFRFRYGAVIPHEGQEYVVLIELEDAPNGDEQIIITRVIDQDGELSFVVEEDAEVVEAVYNLYVMATLQAAGEDHCGCGCDHEHHDCDCGCDHDHDCDCGHDHDCDCGHDHHHGCDCGCHGEE